MTAMFLAIYRVGFYIPLPIVDQDKLQSWQEVQGSSAAGRVFGTVAMFGGTSIGMSTIFGLGIMPYISASIIFQLLGSVVPSLEAMMKEGESGRKKINEYTRYATVFLCIGQSAFWVRYMMNDMEVVPPAYRYFSYGMVSVLIMTAGTIFLMWIGEQIDEYGIGNGISLLIMAGILAKMPQALWSLVKDATPKLTDENGKFGVVTLALLAALFVAVVVGVIAITESQRRIPTQSAKHVRGRRVYGGTRQFLPLKVNQAGVMPVIFASSLLLIPGFIFSQIAHQGGDWAGDIGANLQRGSGWLYNVLYIALIYFFCYFWTAITFNPKDMANNLKDYGSFIPGYRPGKSTSDYLEKVLMRITYVGAAFLAVIAIIPSIISGELQIPGAIATFYGGTSLLIVVSVCLDLVQKINSHLVMRGYPGLTED